MQMPDIIRKKREGQELTEQEIAFFVNGFVDGSIRDYQAAALLMAICFQGMTPEETVNLTMAMVQSGDVVDLSSIAGIKVDKHSTGGVGDTTTLIVAPLVAACGAPVAKMSGRGLGHTGGTIDKLESLPGVRVERTIDEFIAMVQKNGIAVVGQSDNLVPADKKIYALRDVTATVDSIPLIASSIMSKKIAAGSDAIVLDVKMGNGAFMKTKEEAFALATCMVQIGDGAGRETVAIITDMDQPLGTAIGNELELREAIEVLQGKIPMDDPLIQVSFLLARKMLLLAHMVETEEEAEAALIDALTSGRALEKLRQLLISLGNDGACIDSPELLGRTSIIKTIASTEDGFVSVDSLDIGLIAQQLGAGRLTKEDRIDYQVGLVMYVRSGQEIQKGDPLYTIYANDEQKCENAEKRMQEAIRISKTYQQPEPMVIGIVDRENI